MKFLNCLIVVLIFTFVIACEKNFEKIDIKGDWYRCNSFTDSIDSSQKEQLFYEEYFFTDSLIFSYTNYAGYISPTNFYIKNDSLFSAFGLENSNYEYKGRIKMISNNHFIFFDDSFVVNYFRLPDTTEILSKYIINLNTDNPTISDSHLTFGKAFRLRINDCESTIINSPSKIND